LKIAATCEVELGAKVCVAVQVSACAKFSEATTAPVVGEMVSVLSLFDTELTAPVIVFHEQAEIFPLAVPHSKACVPLGPVAGSWYQFAVKLAEFGPTQPAVSAIGVSVAVLPGSTITPGFDPTAPAATGPGKFVVNNPVAEPVCVKLIAPAASVPVPGTNCIAKQPSTEAAACHSVPHKELIGED
jgi:hypothetical protein